MSSTRTESAPASARHEPVAYPWLVRVSRIAWLIAVPAIAAFVIRELLAGKLGSAVAGLSGASLLWIGVGVAAEGLSYVLYAAAQRRLLGRGGRGITVRWLASLAICAQGVSNFVPAGYLAANLLNFRELRRRGLNAPSSAWLLVMTSAVYISVLALLTLIAGEFAGGRPGGGLEGARVGAAVAIAALPIVGFAARVLLRRGVIRLPRAWRESGDRLRASRSGMASALALFCAAWLADAGCLVAAVVAVGARPAWALVPIAYCAAQLVSFLPITPGGLGLVEGSLTVTLMAGGGGGPVLAAVLLYRMISYWGTLPFGLLGYMAVRRSRLVGNTNSDGHPKPTTALGDRAPGSDRPVLVLEG